VLAIASASAQVSASLSLGRCETAAERVVAAVLSPALAVPASLHASLMARLDRLGPAKEYLDQQSIDTTTPAGKLMFQVTGAFAEFERSMIRQRVNAGLKRAVEAGKTLGRPRVSAAVEKRVQAQLRAGKGILKVAREVGVGTGTVQRIKQEMTGPFAVAAA